MSTTPSGCLSLPQQNLKLLLADVPAFRTWCGAADQAAALARIHLVGLPQPLDFREYDVLALQEYRPFAIINLIRESGFRTVFTAFGGSAFQMDDAGRLELHLEQDSPALPEADAVNGVGPAEADLRFQNSVGAIIDGVKDFTGKGGYLAINDIALREGPFRSREEDWSLQGDFQYCMLEVGWGVSGAGG